MRSRIALPFLMFALFSLPVAPDEHAASQQAAAAMPAQDAEPWKSSEVVQPDEIAKTLSDSKAKKPLVLCVGFGLLYRSAHVPGAVLQGPAANPGGVEALKKWAKDVPHSQSIVIYCGCCPWKHCPNVRPAFQTLKDLGFTHLKVMSIPADFATDWVERGYPIEK